MGISSSTPENPLRADIKNYLSEEYLKSGKHSKYFQELFRRGEDGWVEISELIGNTEIFGNISPEEFMRATEGLNEEVIIEKSEEKVKLKEAIPIPNLPICSYYAGKGCKRNDCILLHIEKEKLPGHKICNPNTYIKEQRGEGMDSRGKRGRGGRGGRGVHGERGGRGARGARGGRGGLRGRGGIERGDRGDQAGTSTPTKSGHKPKQKHSPQVLNIYQATEAALNDLKKRVISNHQTMIWNIPESGGVKLKLGPGLEIIDAYLAEVTNIITIHHPPPNFHESILPQLTGVLEWKEITDPLPSRVMVYFDSPQNEQAAECYLKQNSLEYKPYTPELDLLSNRKQKVQELMVEYSYGIADRATVNFCTQGDILQLPKVNNKGKNNREYFELYTSAGTFKCEWQTGNNWFFVQNPSFYIDNIHLKEYFKNFNGFQKASVIKYSNFKENAGDMNKYMNEEEQINYITQQLTFLGLNIKHKITFPLQHKEYISKLGWTSQSTTMNTKAIFEIIMTPETKRIIQNAQISLPGLAPPPNFSKYETFKYIIPRVPYLNMHPVTLSLNSTGIFSIREYVYKQLKDYWTESLRTLSNSYPEAHIKCKDRPDGRLMIYLRSTEEDIFKTVHSKLQDLVRGTQLPVTTFLAKTLFWFPPLKNSLNLICKSLGLVYNAHPYAKPDPRIDLLGPETKRVQGVQHIKEMLKRTEEENILKFKLPHRKISRKLQFMLQKKEGLYFLTNIKEDQLYVYVPDPEKKEASSEIILKTLEDLKTEITEEKKEETLCGVCYCPIEGNEISHQFEECKCILHMDCLTNMTQHYLSPELKEISVKCPFCSKPLSLNDCTKMFEGTETTNVIKKQLLDSYIQRNLNKYKFCIFPDCGGIYRNPSYTGEEMKEDKEQFKECRVCGNRVCMLCWKAAHDGDICRCSLCPNAYHGNSKCQDSYEHGLIGLNIKACPSCGIVQEKISGCHHVVCGHCHKHFCFKCGNFFADLGEDVYRHMSQAHGDWFI